MMQQASPPTIGRQEPQAPAQGTLLVPPPAAGDLVPVPPPPPRRRWRLALLLVALIAGGLGGGTWWLHAPPPLPPGIAFSNGRLEADEIDISTKFPGRIAEIIEVGLPRPRSFDQEGTPEFQRAAQRIRALIYGGRVAHAA